MLKSFLKKATYISSSSHTRHEEMLLMDHRVHHIIANSTFRSSAAQLSVPHPGKLIFASHPWEVNGQENRYLPDIPAGGWMLL